MESPDGGSDHHALARACSQKHLRMQPYCTPLSYCAKHRALRHRLQDYSGASLQSHCREYTQKSALAQVSAPSHLRDENTSGYVEMDLKPCEPAAYTALPMI